MITLEAPPDSLHDLHTEISKSCSVHDYNLRTESGLPIETNEEYVTEYTRSGVSEYIVIVHTEGDACQTVDASARASTMRLAAFSA
jgi:hypothetical protein